MKKQTDKRSPTNKQRQKKKETNTVSKKGERKERNTAVVLKSHLKIDISAT
jgi:hypothetical protein